MKMTVFWDVELCSLVETDKNFSVLTSSIISMVMNLEPHEEASLSTIKHQKLEEKKTKHIQQCYYSGNQDSQFLSLGTSCVEC
jgi:hypothetical protein